MRLRDFLDPSATRFDLAGPTREGVLTEVVGLLHLSEKSAETVARQLLRREAMGSTGFGAGVAIPHCRTMAVNRLRVAFGRHPAGVDWAAADGKPVHALFLIVAPPMEVSQQYLPVLGRIAQFLHEGDAAARLRAMESPEELFALLDQREI